MALLTIRRRASPSHGAPSAHSSLVLVAPAVATIVDTIAPYSAELTRDALRLDDSYTSGLAVTRLPGSVVAGQLLPVCAADIPFHLSFFIQPISRPSAQRFLLAQTARHGSAQLVSTSRIGNPERDTALEHAQTLRTALERGHEDLFRVSLYGQVRAGSLTALRRLESQLAELLGSAGLGVRRTVLQQLQAFRSVLPQLTNELDDAHYLTTSALAALLPWRAGTLWMPGAVLWGLTQDTHSPVGINLFANPPLTDANCVVFARVRQGKSFFLKLLVRRFLVSDPASGSASSDDQRRHRGGRCVIVDAEASQEYRPLCQDLDGQYVRLGPGSPLRINPFDLPPYDPDDGELADPERAHIASLLRLLELLLADHGQHLTADERAICDLALGATYDRARVDNRTPLLGDLLWVLRHPTDTLVDVDRRLLRSLATRLARWVEGSLGALFGQPTNITLSNPLTVFNVSALDEALRPIGIFLIEQFVWNQQRHQHVLGEDQPCLLVVDELWLTLRTPEGGAFLEAMARKGPKYWFGLVVASQEPADCLASPAGQAIVDNSSTRVLLGMDAGALRTAADTFALTPPEMAALETANAGDALVLCGDQRRLVQLVPSEEERVLFSTTPAEMAERNRHARQRQLSPMLVPPAVSEGLPPTKRAPDSSTSLTPAPRSDAARRPAPAERQTADTGASPAPAARRARLFAGLFEDKELRPNGPISLSVFRQRPPS